MLTQPVWRAKLGTRFSNDPSPLSYYDALEEAHPTLIAGLRRTESKHDGSLWWEYDLPPLKDSESV